MPLALVVDDSRATRSALRRILVGVGFDVVEAEHGEHALEVMHADDSIELVLVDWNMPVMDGFSLIKAIRKERKWALLPIMMVSAEVDQKQIARAVMAGADEYVMKPFDSATLIGKLQALGIATPLDLDAGPQ
jgi:two-component system, chemotaxis family, chemotaxis protein CheY